MASPADGDLWGAYRRALAGLAADGGTAATVPGRRQRLGAVVGGVAEAVLAGSWDGPEAGPVPAPPAALAGPGLVGRVLEALLDPPARRASGAHHTPPWLAARLVDLVIEPMGHGAPPTVCDPAVGGGAFLLAAADALVADGVGAPEVIAGLHGADTDELAVWSARAAVRAWAHAHGVGVPEGLDRRIAVADGLVLAPGRGPGGPPAGHDLVVGNPPFLGQLAGATVRTGAARRQLRARFGEAATGYVDTAALFLLAGLDLARPGGRVVMLQPESTLAARDAGNVRAAVARSATVTDVWVAGEKVFDAGVRACAIAMVRGEVDAAPPPKVWRGVDFEPVDRAPRPAARSSDPLPAAPFAGVVARARGIPIALLDDLHGHLGDLASITAGFRDQFYGLVPHVTEAVDPDPARLAPLVTSGAIDPLRCGWGDRRIRFAGTSWQHPAVDLSSVGDDGIGRWVRARLVPKVLVASQTRVLEAVADPSGRLVPSVPVVSVEPGDPGDLWRVLAVLLAPPVTAWLLERSAGTALAGDALKAPASLLRLVPLPGDGAAWDEAAALVAEPVRGRAGAEAFASVACRAYGLGSSDPVESWWLDRLPSWG